VLPWYNFRIHDLRYHPSSKRLTVECDPSQGIARECVQPRRFRTSACAKHRHIGYDPVWRKAYSWHDDWLRSAPGQTFAFRQLNKRRLLNAEADQTLMSRECQYATFPVSTLDFAERHVWNRYVVRFRPFPARNLAQPSAARTRWTTSCGDAAARVCSSPHANCIPAGDRSSTRPCSGSSRCDVPVPGSMPDP